MYVAHKERRKCSAQAKAASPTPNCLRTRQAVCTHTRTHTRLHAHMHAHTNTYTHTNTHTHTRTHTHTCARTRMHAHTCTHTHAHNARAHACTHTHTPCLQEVWCGFRAGLAPLGHPHQTGGSSGSEPPAHPGQRAPVCIDKASALPVGNHPREIRSAAYEFQIGWLKRN